MATRIVVVQHGEKVRVAGDPGLTDVGHEQAETTAAWIARSVGSDVAAVVSSPLLHACQTAAPIAARLGLDVSTDDRLRERMNWTADSGLELDAFLAEWERATADRTHVPPLGDSSVATADRMLAALDDLATTHADRTVIVTSHGGATVDLLRTLLGDDAVDVELIAEGPSGCAITELVGAPGDWQVIRAADTHHLPAEK